MAEGGISTEMKPGETSEIKEGRADRALSLQRILAPCLVNERGDCRSFSALLAGAMSSPSAKTAPQVELQPPETLAVEAVRLAAAPSQRLVGVSSTPAFQGKFEMSHQEALATVTAQAAKLHAEIAAPSRCISSTSDVLLVNPVLNVTPTSISPSVRRTANPSVSKSDSSIAENDPTLSSPKISQTTILRKKALEDGYNWRKYGHKQVKGTDYTRSYFKCTGPCCPVKKKVVRNIEHQVVEIIYISGHTHDPPCKSRGTKDEDLFDHKSEDRDVPGKPQVQCLSDFDEKHKGRHNSKRIKDSSKVFMHATNNQGIKDDGYRWRKYGQKMVKGNTNPRSYYKCTFVGCPVRRHVERSSHDAAILLISYEGRHNHECPAHKKINDSSSTALLLAAAAITDGHFSRQNQPDLYGDPLVDSTMKGETVPKAAELGGDKALESAQTLLSIGLTDASMSEMGAETNKPYIIQKPSLNKAVLV